MPPWTQMRTLLGQIQGRSGAGWTQTNARSHAETRYSLGQPIDDSPVSANIGNRQPTATPSRDAGVGAVTARRPLIRDPRPQFPPAKGLIQEAMKHHWVVIKCQVPDDSVSALSCVHLR